MTQTGPSVEVIYDEIHQRVKFETPDGWIPYRAFPNGITMKYGDFATSTGGDLFRSYLRDFYLSTDIWVRKITVIDQEDFFEEPW